jgi:hypothetical protein
MKLKTEHYILGAAAVALGYAVMNKKSEAAPALGRIELDYLQNYHILKINYLGATNYKSSRVKITSERFEQSRIINYDHDYNSIADIAQAYLEKKGFKFIGKGESKDGLYLISTTFEPLK